MAAGIEKLVEIGKRGGVRGLAEAQAHHLRLAGLHHELVAGGGLGTALRGVHGRGLALHDVLVDAVFEVAAGLVFLLALLAEERGAGFIFAEQQLGGLVAVELVAAQIAVLGGQGIGRSAANFGPVLVVAQRPGIAKPELRQHLQRRGFGAAVVDGELNEQVLRAGLGVFDEHVEVAAFGENTGIE